MSPPCCKPFRIAELICLIFAFCLLFFLRKYDADYQKVVPSGFLIYFFTCFGSFLFLLMADTFAQMIRQPISNAPMVKVLVLGTIFCFISGILGMVAKWVYLDPKTLTTQNALSLLILMSFSTTVLFILDIIIVCRLA